MRFAILPPGLLPYRSQSVAPPAHTRRYHYRPEEHEWYRAHGGVDTKVTCPAGSVIIWDSRLIHWNCMPTGSRTRVATYACYSPKSFASEGQLERKRELFKKRWMTTHVSGERAWRVLLDISEILR